MIQITEKISIAQQESKSDMRPAHCFAEGFVPELLSVLLR